MLSPFAQLPPSDPRVYVNGRCLQVGVLSNPRSGGNKKGGKTLRHVLARWPDVVQGEAWTPDGVSQTLAGFARSGVDLVVINGGDGTVQAALTAIGNEQLFPKPPLFALLCAGTTSMLARDVGITGPPAVALLRVLEWAKSPDASLAVRSRPVLQVLRASHAPSLFGMFFGAGAICQGIKIFHNRDNPMGWRGELMPAFTMLRLLLAILAKDREKVPPLLTRTSLDGRPAQEQMNLFVLISTLERLFLGMRPYWGDEDGPLRYTAVGAEPKHLLRVLVSLFRSEQSRHATPANGYSSHNVREVRLDMAGDFTLDGELYAAGDGPVTIASAAPAMFLCLP
jgi:diacylglycerol kinase family enzyme